MQEAWKVFDGTTIWKWIKGAAIAATAAFALYLLNALGALEVENPLFASLLVWLVPTLTNMIREWVKGN